MAQSAKEDKARGIVLISGNKYMTTAGRVMAIHEKYPGCVQISTKILNDDELKVEMMATVEITDETGTRKFTGFAREHYEVKTQKDVNYASALENCETSAVGRAIGFAGVGLLPESGFASADEIEGIDRKKKAVDSQLDAKKKNPDMKAIWELAQEKNVNANGLQALMAETLDTEVKDSSSLSTAQLKKVYDALKAKAKDEEVVL